MSADHLVTATTMVAAPIEAVWSLLSDTARYEEWVESTIRVLHADGPARLGAIYEERTRLSGFWTANTRWEVVDCREPHHLAFEGMSVPAVRRILIEFEAKEAGGGTEVSSTYSYSLRFGAIGSAIEFGFKNNVTAEQRRTLRTFGILVEREQAERDT